MKTVSKRGLLSLSILALCSIAYGFVLYKVCTLVFRPAGRSASIHPSAAAGDGEEVDRLIRLIKKPTPSERPFAALDAAAGGE